MILRPEVFVLEGLVTFPTVSMRGFVYGYVITIVWDVLPIEQV